MTETQKPVHTKVKRLCGGGFLDLSSILRAEWAIVRTFSSDRSSPEGEAGEGCYP